MTTAGELLRATSGLLSATAAEHLLAAHAGQGVAPSPVFGQRFSLAISNPKACWLHAGLPTEYLFIEEPPEAQSRTTIAEASVAATQAPMAAVFSTQRTAFVVSRPAGLFLRKVQASESICTVAA